MKKFLSCGWLFFSVLALSGQVPSSDTPVKGEWDFHPEKIWEIHQAGNDDFGKIGELLVSSKSRICVRDFQRNISYLFDESGKLIRKFAASGEGNGELSHYLNRFRAGDKIVLASPDKLHFYSPDGTFERATGNNIFQRFPLCFVSEHEFVYAPSLPMSPVNEKKLVLADIKTGLEKTLADFSGGEAPDAASSRGPMLMIPSLTPRVQLAFDGQVLVFGRTDQYLIFTAGPDGKIRSSFGLDRKKIAASPEEKRQLLDETRLSAEQKDKIITVLPGQLASFNQLTTINGFTYVYAITQALPKTRSQQIDVFSARGEYLYRGRIEFGQGLEFNTPANLVIADGFAYVILENGQGSQTLAKYRIQLPR